MRPPTAADAEAVLDVIVASDEADLGAPDFTLADLEADWATPGVDLARDARVVSGGGRPIAAYALITPADDAFVVVHPEVTGQGLGTLLRTWVEGRAAERGGAILRQYAYAANGGARGLLEEAGYEPAKTFFRLRAELDAVPAPPPARIRSFEPADAAPVHALVQAAFADIDGQRAVPFERWRAQSIDKAGFDPALWLLLEDDQGLAGVSLGERWPDGGGYVSELAVDRRARGRGHGRTLLLAAFAAFRRAGLRFAELSVQADNRGALKLYRSAGMEPTFELQRWEKRLAGG